jgi:hypothetical protein
MQLWGMASTSNMEIPECFQSKALQMIVDAPWYVPNMVIQRNFQAPTVKKEISRPNDRIVNLMELPDNR